jgi:hypothetical protein
VSREKKKLRPAAMLSFRLELGNISFAGSTSADLTSNRKNLPRNVQLFLTMTGTSSSLAAHFQSCRTMDWLFYHIEAAFSNYYL